ncbi:MAG: hypothetical protein M3Y41_03185 [Pseudomonadota bacterium]|nr:hypothetical protein [Pseudomonadota bacterium]
MIRAAILAGLAALGAPALANAQAPSPAPPFSISPGQTRSDASRLVAKQSRNQVLTGRAGQTSSALHTHGGQPGARKMPMVGGTARVPHVPGTAAGDPGSIAR